MQDITDNWPPNYAKIFAERMHRLSQLKANPKLIPGALQFYAKNPVAFIEHWAVTYDPRNAGNPDKPSTMPFILFPKQRELVEFLHSCVRDQEGGLIEKSRDMGATWVCGAFSIWVLLFYPGTAVGWGSRKEMLVDRIGDMSSIFEKMRAILRNLPPFLLPVGFNPKNDMPYMKILNRDNGSSIIGEAGDNIGRGGRTLLYIKDEAAFYERPELIEAALGDNTNVQIDLSTVHGTNNPFYQRRKNGIIWEPDKNIPSGKTRVFVLDWRDHPHKTQEWYDKRRRKAESEGMLHLFKQEVDRDYTGAVENLLIPSAWVNAAIDCHKKLGVEKEGRVIAGLDVADEGGDRNAIVIRQGCFLLFSQDWGEGDTFDTATKGLQYVRQYKAGQLNYDCIGVGAGVKAGLNKLDTNGVEIIPWNAAAAVRYPDRRVINGDRESPRNRDFFANLKAQAWWAVRTRFYKTYLAVNGGDVDLDEIICLPPGCHSLVQELSQPTYSHDSKGRVVVDKKPNGGKSPNLADAFVMSFYPLDKPKFFA